MVAPEALRVDGLSFSYTRGRLARRAFSASKILAVVSAAVLGAGAMASGDSARADWGVAVGLVVALDALVMMIAGAVASVRTRPEGGALVVGDDDVAEVHTRRGVRALPLGDFDKGLAVTVRGRCELRLEGTDGDLYVVACPDAATADLVLHRLRLGADARRYAVRWGRRSARVALAIALGTVAWVAVAILTGSTGREPSDLRTALVAIPLVPLAVAWAVAAFGWREMTIGADGVVVEHIGFATRFVPYARIASVTERRASIELSLDDGERVSVWAAPGEAALRRAVVRRIEQARAVSRGAHRPLALAARAGLSLGQWRQALAAPAGYREAALSSDDAARVLVDAGASAEQRIAAALCLVNADDGRARVRVAAEACASARMRVALERVADDTLSDEIVDGAIGDDASAPRGYAPAGVRAAT